MEGTEQRRNQGLSKTEIVSAGSETGILPPGMGGVRFPVGQRHAANLGPQSCVMPAANEQQRKNHDAHTPQPVARSVISSRQQSQTQRGEKNRYRQER